MNPSKVKMVGEDDGAFRMHDGASEFRVPKAGLSPALKARIQAMAQPQELAAGGAVGPPVAYDAYGNPLASYQPAGAGGGGGYSLPPTPMDGAQGGSGQQVPVTEAPTFNAPTPAYAYAGNAPSSNGAGGGPGVESPQTVFDPTRGGNVIDVGQGAQSGGNAPKPAAPSLRVADMTDLPASFRPKGAPAPEVAPPVMPAGPAAGPRVAGNGPGMPGLSDIRKGTAAGQAAALEGAAAATEEGRQKALAIGAYETQLKANQLEDKARADAARVRTDGLMADYQAAQQEMRNINTTVDPGRYWASRSTGGKIAGIIGLALGALGTGPDGVNRAAVMMNQAIDRDLEAQKAEHSLRLQKGKAAIDAAQTAYGMEHQRFGDEAAASNAAKASMLGLAENELKKIAAGSAGPAAQANAKALSAQLQVQQGQLTSSLANIAFDNETARELANKKVEGGGLSPVETKDLHNAESAAQNSLDFIRDIRKGLADTNSIIPGKTAINQNVGGDAAKLATANTGLMLEMKNFAKLGVLSASDAKILDELQGDPAAVFTNESTKRAKLDALEQMVKRGIANHRASVTGARAR